MCFYYLCLVSFQINAAKPYTLEAHTHTLVGSYLLNSHLYLLYFNTLFYRYYDKWIYWINVELMFARCVFNSCFFLVPSQLSTILCPVSLSLRVSFNQFAIFLYKCFVSSRCVCRVTEFYSHAIHFLSSPWTAFSPISFNFFSFMFVAVFIIHMSKRWIMIKTQFIYILQINRLCILTSGVFIVLGIAFGQELNITNR